MSTATNNLFVQPHTRGFIQCVTTERLIGGRPAQPKFNSFGSQPTPPVPSYLRRTAINRLTWPTPLVFRPASSLLYNSPEQFKLALERLVSKLKRFQKAEKSIQLAVLERTGQ
jgi:hypothetical protein